jgi:hypothetical protein
VVHPAFYVVLGWAWGAVLLAWLYFRRHQVTRPPIGVFNLGDVAIMLVAIVVVPYLYLLLPLWLVAALLATGVLSILYTAFEPILRARWLIWLAVLGLVAADIGSVRLFGPASLPFFLVNNTVLLCVVVGITNLWVQSGIKARDVAVLAAALAVYDLVATGFLPLMTDLIGRLAEIPFAPMVAWSVDPEGHWLGIGLGDLLLAAVFPLVMRKAFGRGAGIAALVGNLAAISGLLALVDLYLVLVTLPAMVVLGPLMVLQYVYWIRRQGYERTTQQYVQAEPRRTASP